MIPLEITTDFWKNNFNLREINVKNFNKRYLTLKDRTDSSSKRKRRNFPWQKILLMTDRMKRRKNRTSKSKMTRKKAMKIREKVNTYRNWKEVSKSWDKNLILLIKKSFNFSRKKVVKVDFLLLSTTSQEIEPSAISKLDRWSLKVIKLFF